jgi:serine/threonine protein kinase
MAKRYGSRWEIVDGAPLGGGGQGTVFRVRDISKQLEGEFALKRIPDISRRERFRREVEAIKRLTDPETHQAHPNVISLVDHSALDETGNSEKQFLVMPIANGGDLSTPGRLALYKDSIDGVLQVAKQLAAALIAAHAAQIIHRDVKPKNILFTGNGHETWLSDFGICLIREVPRITETSEVMGPRAFMAPELEDGGQLDVSYAADIYSLGKVIFYMLSGGVIVPRERLHEPQFSQIFARGQRHGLLEMVLRRMICPLDRRIQSAAEVLRELEKIEAWEKTAQLLPMSGSALAAVEQFKRRSLETGRIVAENNQARHQEAQALGAVQQSVAGWLTSELTKVASVASFDSIKCEVRDAAVSNGPRVQTGHNSMYRVLNGVELTVEDINDSSGRTHSMQFFLCEHIKTLIVFQTGAQPSRAALTPARDIELAILPVYSQVPKQRSGRFDPPLGYVSRIDQVGKIRGRVELPPGVGGVNKRHIVHNYRVDRIAYTFEKEVAMHADFKASEWPGNEEYLRATLTDAIDAFFAQISG